MPTPRPAPRLVEIFSEALELTSAEERAAYLDRVCGSDRSLRGRVEGLLRAHVKGDDFLEVPAPAPTVDATPGGAPAPEGPGTVIGPYTLREQIGDGGMGVVYVAEQAQPVRRRVALKIIKPGMDTKQVIARFEAERQALAMMDHPSIAKVHDGGATGSGRPYFVMELVRGIPITEYCDRERLSIAERLELFVQVCRAVQHAHQKGIIHRDLKPTNILVTVIDGAAVPKVIDFGVAKATGAALTERTIYTAFQQFVGTPLYMSPEQADLSSMDVDTRSDIYSLGVLLYELLTGTTPFDRETFHKGAFDELRRIIREHEPPRPSTRLSSLGAKRETVSANRKADARHLDRAVRGELDWIVMKALEKDRRRRYETANDFASDVVRYLTDEPVQACPPSAWYRLSKAARRNRAALATTALVGLALALGTAVSAWQAVRATTAEAQANANATQAEEKAHEATAQRDEAQKQRDQVRGLNDRLQRTLYAAHMNVAQHTWEDGNIQRVQELLDQHRPKAGESDLRGFEWYYLDRLCHAEILSIKGAGGAVFSPDGTRLASTIGGGPGTRLASTTGGGPGASPEVRVWDAQTGQLLRTIKGVASPAFSPDGTRLATGDDNTIKIWDAQAGQELSFIKGHTGRVLRVAYSPDGKRLASAARKGQGDGDGEIKVWDAGTGQEILSIKGEGNLVFSPDGKRLAFGSGTWDDTKRAYVGCELQLWDAQTGQALLAIKELTERVSSMAFSPDGKSLAGATDHTAKVWDAQTGQELFTLKDAHDSVTFSPDGKRLASRVGRTVKVWDAQTGQELLSCKGHNGQINTVAFSPDGKRLASAGWDRMVHVWDAQTGQELLKYKGHSGMIWTVAFSPDGTRLASTSMDGTVRVWDATTSPEARTFGEPASGVCSVVFSPDGKRLADVSWGNMAKGHTVKVWDAQTGRELFSVNGGTGDDDFSLAFSPDGKRLAGADTDHMVKLWDAQTGQVLFSFKIGTSSCVAFNADGNRLVSASRDNTVKEWDAQTGQELFSFKIGPSSRVAFTPDGKRLATVSGRWQGGRRGWDGVPGDVKVWDTQTGQELRSLKGFAGPYPSLAFSPDGKRLASSHRLSNSAGPAEPGEIKVWDAQAGQELLTLKGHIAEIKNIVFSPDGKRLASSARWTNAVKVWDAQTGQELFNLKAGGEINNLAFSPDGHWLVGDPGGTVTIWDATPLLQKP